MLFFVTIKEVNAINSATTTTNKSVARDLGERENHGAKIRVHVLDCSEDGHVKGSNRDVIIVERCMSKTGYNGCKLCSKKGKECSKSKKDV